MPEDGGPPLPFAKPTAFRTTTFKGAETHPAVSFGAESAYLERLALPLSTPVAPAKSYPRLRAFVKGLIELSASGTGTIIRARVEEPLVALTFDDGPDPEWTPKILEVLARHEARATFFMIGKRAAKHPELVRRVAGGGHAIGNHSWDHPSFPLLKGRWRRAQIRWAGEALKPYGEKLFRPPYGHQSLGSRLDAARLGYRVVTWTVNAEDWRDDPADALVSRVRARLVPGSLLLFHDSLFSTDDLRFRDRGPTLEAVERLLAELSGSYGFVTVPELLRRGRPRRWHWYWRSDFAWLHKLQ